MHKIRIVGHGNTPFIVTDIEDLAAFMVDTIKREEVSKNKTLSIRGDIITLNSLKDKLGLSADWISLEDAKNLVAGNELSMYIDAFLILVEEGKAMVPDNNNLCPNLKFKTFNA